MKKFSKLLALLLAVVVIMTAFTVVSLATEESDSHTKAMGAKWDGKAPGTFVGVNEARYGYMYSAMADDGNYYVIYEPKDGSGNNFVEPDLDKTRNTNQTYKYNSADYPYMMFDFDIMTPTGTHNGGISFNFRSELTTARTSGTTYNDYPVSFLASAFTTTCTDNTPYKWQHATVLMHFVFDVDVETGKTSAAKVEMSYYVNGDFKYSGTIKPGRLVGHLPVDLGWSSMRLNGTAGTDTNMKTALDNFRISYFTENFGTADEMVATVYTDNYPMPYGKTVAKIGDAPYDDINKAIAAAEKNATIKLVSDIAGAVTVDKTISIDKNIYAEDGVTPTGNYYNITTSSSTLVPTEEAGIIKFSAEQNANVEVYWDDCATCTCDPDSKDYIEENHAQICPTCTCDAVYDGHALYLVGSAMLNTVPEYKGTIPEFSIDENGVQKKHVGWTYTPGGEKTELKAITADDCSEGYISIYPVYETVQYDFKVVDPNKEVTYYKADEMTKMMTAAPAGSTITLLTDVETSSGMTVTKSLTFDFNGKTFKKSNVSVIQYKATDNGDGTYKKTSTALSWGTKSSVFYMQGADIEFTIKSSKPGATVFNGTLMKTNDYYCDGKLVMQVVDGTMKGGQFVSYGTAKGSTLNIEGDNLSFYGSVIADVDNGNNSNATVNITGGTYYRIVSDYSALITNRVGAAFNVKNATLVGSSTTLMYIWASKTDSHQASVFEGCDFIGGDFYTNDSSAVTFKNCRVEKANISNGGGGSAFVMDEGTLLTAKFPANATLAEGLEYVDTTTSKTYVISDIVEYDISEDGTQILDSTYDITTKEHTVEYKYVACNLDSLVTVNWVDKEDNLISTSSALKNSKVTPPQSATVPAGDGWRRIVVSEWLDSEGNVSDLVIGTDSEYTFVASDKVDENTTYVAGITDAKMNIGYYAQFWFYMYLPVTEGMEMPTVSGFIKGNVVLIENVEYWSYYQTGSTATVFNDKTATVTYTIEDVEYSQSYVISGYWYATRIMNKPTATDKEKATIANMARFLRESLKAQNSTNSGLFAKIDTLIGSEDGTVEGMYKLPDYIADTEYPDLSLDYKALSDYVESAHFKMWGDYAAYEFVLTDKAMDEGVKIEVISASGTNLGPRYIEDAKRPWTINMRVYHAIEKLTINAYKTVEGKKEIIGTCSYSIGSYINGAAAQGQNVDLARALYAFGTAVKEYRDSRTDY